MKTFIKKLTLVLCFKMKKEVLKKFKGVKFIDIKSVFFKTILQKRTGTTCKARLQFSPLTYRSSSLIVQWYKFVSHVAMATIAFQDGG